MLNVRAKCLQGRLGRCVAELLDQPPVGENRPIAKEVDLLRPVLGEVQSVQDGQGRSNDDGRDGQVALAEFVGDVPWAHIDMAGPMNIESDSGWKAKGATGYGARLLIDFAVNFTPSR